MPAAAIPILPLAFFLSGAAGLLFEVLWFRALGRVLGNTVWAGTVVLAAFMLGIALGGMLAARSSQRIRHAARAFAAAEGVVALGGCLLAWGLPAAEPLIGQWLSPLAESPLALNAARLVLASAVMLVPTVAMGMTLPLGVRVLAGEETTKALGILYAANTFGACIAPLVAEYFLIGALGLRGTALAAATLNMAAAGLALRVQPADHPRRAGPLAVKAEASAARLLLLAAGAGALALALEVIWFRLLILHAPAADTNFAIMLTLFLTGIALGGAIAPALAQVRLTLVTAGGSVAVVVGYLLAAPSRGAGLSQLIHYSIPLMLPAAILSGCVFTRIGAELRAHAPDPLPAIGRLTLANALGGACGAPLAGFVMLPQLGIESSLFWLAAGYGVLPLLLIRRRTEWMAAWPAAVAAAGLLLFPFGRMNEHLAQAARPYRALDGSSVVQVIQGPTTTLQVMRTERFGETAAWRLLTDSYSMSAIDRNALRYMQLFAWLPLALHPDPRRVLLISYGAGNTAHALLGERALEQLTVVDVSPEILSASAILHGNGDPLRDPRVRVVLEDGRHFLRTRRERFDLITSEPPPPMMAGVVNLYTREYFSALAGRLAPGGLATYWLPIHQLEPRGAHAVIAAFCEVFPDCTMWAGSGYHWILMGGRDFAYRPDPAHFARGWRDAQAGPRVRASGLEHPGQLGATFLADAAQLREWYRDARPLTDNHPKRLAAPPRDDGVPDEYAKWQVPETARRHFESSQWIARHWPEAMIRESLPYFAVQPITNGMVLPDPVRNLPLVDGVLRNTDLRIPILWLLGSDVPEQRILLRATGADARKRTYPVEFAYPLGIRALADRDFARAGELFGEVAERDPRAAGALAAYALCRAGQAKRAAAVPGAGRLPPELRCWRGR